MNLDHIFDNEEPGVVLTHGTILNNERKIIAIVQPYNLEHFKALANDYVYALEQALKHLYETIE